MAGTPLRDLARLFLRLGSTSFGGPAAHTALMERETVTRAGWLGREEFLDLVALTQLIPGPNSTELAMLIGQRRAGLRGLVVAGACFIVPAAVIVSVIAWLYTRDGAVRLPAQALIWVRPVVVAILAHAMMSFGKTTLRSAKTAGIALLSLVAAFLGAPELATLLIAALVSLIFAARARPSPPAAGMMFGLSPSLFAIAWSFLKIGAILYGSGYVLVALVRAELVQRLGWITETQLLDGLAVGQTTPGPLFTTATFLGWILSGPAGAAVATIAIFLPSFALVATLGPLLPRFARTWYGRPILDGLGAASVALLGHSAFQIARAALITAPAAMVAAVAFGLLFTRLPATVVILVALVAGFF